MIKFIFKELQQPILVVVIFFSILFTISFILYQRKEIQYLNDRLSIKPEIVYLQELDTLQVNKIQKTNDSLKVELFIANYKLARIKEYTELAEHGSNYRYLRGWINRVLEKHDEF